MTRVVAAITAFQSTRPSVDRARTRPRAMPRARRALVVALVVALCPRASSARAISREDAFVGYSERARGATLRLTLDGDGAGDARAIALRLREDWAPTLARELAGGAARRRVVLQGGGDARGGREGWLRWTGTAVRAAAGRAGGIARDERRARRRSWREGTRA